MLQDCFTLQTKAKRILGRRGRKKKRDPGGRVEESWGRTQRSISDENDALNFQYIAVFINIH